MKLPLEIKLIIYNYYDPKDKLVVVDYIKEYNNYFIYIECKINLDISKVNIFFRYEQYYFEILKKKNSDDDGYDSDDGYTIEHFLWRKSQVNNCFERLKQWEQIN